MFKDGSRDACRWRRCSWRNSCLGFGIVMVFVLTIYCQTEMRYKLSCFGANTAGVTLFNSENCRPLVAESIVVNSNLTDNTDNTAIPSENPTHPYTNNTDNIPTENPTHSYTNNADDIAVSGENPTHSYINNADDIAVSSENPTHSYTNNADDIAVSGENPAHSYINNPDDIAVSSENPTHSYTNNADDIAVSGENPTHSYTNNIIPDNENLPHSYTNNAIPDENPTHSYTNSAIPDENLPHSYTIVTAASSNHYCPVRKWIYNTYSVVSSLPASKRPRIIIYDLGLRRNQRTALESLHRQQFFTEFIPFNYSAYPDFMNVKVHAGQYAWKPAIVHEVSQRFPGDAILWLDAGSLIKLPFAEIFLRVLRNYHGFLSSSSSGNLKYWTYPGVFEFFGETNTTGFSKVPMCNAAAIGFDTRLTQDLINKWFACALIEECIAPAGSNRMNHRQDQSILSYLVMKMNGDCSRKKVVVNGVATHKDAKCEQVEE